ncbi:formyl-CoA transferase [Sphingobium jiangsuense]|uniref:Formyl-CoA transferase n=1 Tax=Sphingobium jiangsuense TaxID=870476 RepID=A0A7W6FSB1_9SPHN|nr:MULTISPECIES: CaiB/BaiF CoA-transferase family protein [Sphingobium]MBB3928858.1 formyl-CoA transferase [Sphingobium jiangsuense]WRD78583.1 CaiB/BaiF CoA-transferase family protein [Sphingobium baderi]
MSKEIPVDSPLKGVRVLEIAQFIAGPFAGQQLADYGAEVIKIERPGGGDPFRTYVGGRNVPNYGCNFRAFNRNKKSVALDLGSPEAREIIKKIAAETDVVLENFRPGVMDRLGIGYEALKEINPGIIYCAVAGFSADGPFRNRPAFDTVGQALSGILYLFTDHENPVLRGPTVSDQVTGMQAATAILAKLRAKEVTGEGGRIDITMVDASVSFIPDFYAGYTDAQIVPTWDSRGATSQACIMTCADGKLIAVQLGALEKAFFALIELLGCPQLATDPRFAKQADRRANWGEFINVMRPYFAARPLAHWMEGFAEKGVPYAEILTIPEVYESPEVVHGKLFETREHPIAGPVTMVRRSARLSGSRGPAQNFPPLLGEHSQEILSRIGYTNEEISNLSEQGIVINS